MLNLPDAASAEIIPMATVPATAAAGATKASAHTVDAVGVGDDVDEVDGVTLDEGVADGVVP